MDLDVVLLSRIQFAFVVSWHIIFPAFTIGLAAWLATFEGMSLATALQRHQVRQISPEPQTIPPSNVPAAGIKALKFRDPGNHDLELIWFPRGKGAPRWQQPGDRLFLGRSHTAITISDTATSEPHVA